VLSFSSLLHWPHSWPDEGSRPVRQYSVPLIFTTHPPSLTLALPPSSAVIPIELYDCRTHVVPVASLPQSPHSSLPLSLTPHPSLPLPRLRHSPFSPSPNLFSPRIMHSLHLPSPHLRPLHCKVTLLHRQRSLPKQLVPFPSAPGSDGYRRLCCRRRWFLRSLDGKGERRLRYSRRFLDARDAWGTRRWRYRSRSRSRSRRK
jgi:hypothetical protein